MGSGALVAAVLALGAGLAGCRIPDAKVWNLRELHESDGSAANFGAVRSDFNYIIATALESLKYRGGESTLFEPKEERIKDPLGECLENLNGLAKCNSEKPRVVAQKAEYFSWLAARDTYVLSRERCCIELGPLGERLGVRKPELFDERVPSTPEDVGAALTELLRVTRPALEKSGPVDSEELRSVCTSISDMPMDLDGGRRMLSAITILQGSLNIETGELSTLGELHKTIQRRCVAYGLAEALSDPEGRVRAAAVAAASQAAGHGNSRLLQAALVDNDPLVRTVALRLVAEHGIPEPPLQLDPWDTEHWRALWIEALITQASQDGPVSVAACRALKTTTFGSLDTLRPEEWQVWWEGERKSLTDSGVLPAELIPPDSTGPTGSAEGP